MSGHYRRAPGSGGPVQFRQGPGQGAALSSQLGSLSPRVSLEIALALAEITWKSEQNTPAILRLDLVRIDALGGVNLDFEEYEEVTDDGGPLPPSRVDNLGRLLQGMLSGSLDREKTLDLHPDWGELSSEIRNFLRLTGHPDRNQQPDLDTALRTLSGLVERSEGRALSHWATQHLGTATTRPPMDEEKRPQRETPVASPSLDKPEDTLPLDKGQEKRRSPVPPLEPPQVRRPGVLLLTLVGVLVGGGITLSVRALNRESLPIPEAVVHLPSPEVGVDLALPTPTPTPTPTPEPPPRDPALQSVPEVPVPEPVPEEPPAPTYTGTILVDAHVDITLHCSDGQNILFQRRTELQLSGVQTCTLTSEDYRGEVSFRGPSRYRCWPEQRTLICGELGQ